MKGSMLMGTQRNKLGNMVYYRRRGQEIARARVSPANPRSERQARQRMNFGTLQQAKSRLAEIVNHSYQGVVYGDISLNHFTKLNVPLLAYAAANPSENAAYFLPKGVKALAPNEYIVSDGSLAQLPLKANGNGVELQNSEYTAALTGPDDYVAQLASLGFQPGDQLTAMCIINTGSIIATTPAGDSIFDMQMLVKRIVFRTLDEVADWTSITSLWAATSDPGRYNVNPALLVADKSDNIVFGTTEPGQTSGTVGVSFVDEVDAYGNSANLAASVVIRSSLVNGQWLRSPQHLLLNDDGESRPSVADVLSTYMDVETDPESPWYLNQSQARNRQTIVGDEPYFTVTSSTGGTFSNNTFAQSSGSEGMAYYSASGVVSLEEVFASHPNYSVGNGIAAYNGYIVFASMSQPASCVFDVKVDGTIVTRITAYVAAE